MRIFGGERIQKIMNRMKFPEDEPIVSSMVSKAIESAQKKVEGHNFDCNFKSQVQLFCVYRYF